jgi:hypothetical protein
MPFAWHKNRAAVKPFPSGQQALAPVMHNRHGRFFGQWFGAAQPFLRRRNGALQENGRRLAAEARPAQPMAGGPKKTRDAKA